MDAKQPSGAMAPKVRAGGGTLSKLLIRLAHPRCG